MIEKGDESEEEDQECALSDQWTFQRHSRRWSRIENLPDDATDATDATDASAASIEEPKPSSYMLRNRCGSVDDVIEDVTDGVGGVGDVERTDDPIILGSFRRSSSVCTSERLKHGAKSLLRRMESLRSRSRRRPTAPTGAGGTPIRNGLVISAPTPLDASAMNDRMKQLNCVDLTPPDSQTPSTTPSPDLNRILSVAGVPSAGRYADTASAVNAANAANAAHGATGARNRFHPISYNSHSFQSNHRH